MNIHVCCLPRVLSALATLLIAGGMSATQVIAQDSAQRAAKADDDRLERFAEMKELVSSFKVVAIDDEGKETLAILVVDPRHSWTDPTRDFHGGALWVWRASGRPVAVIGVELYASWSLEFVLVCPGRVKAENDSVRWTPRKGGIEFHEIPDAPAPAAGEAGRLRQMRDLVKRFSARENWIQGGNNAHYALRLLPHPIDRYSDPAAGVVDGSLFVFANGTNPESLLLIEARRHGDGAPEWSFAAVAFSHAEVSLQLGSRDVWTSPSKDTGQPARPDDPYYDTLVPRRFSARKPKDAPP
jgi:hypothetical protein